MKLVLVIALAMLGTFVAVSNPAAAECNIDVNVGGPPDTGLGFTGCVDTCQSIADAWNTTVPGGNVQCF